MLSLSPRKHKNTRLPLSASDIVHSSADTVDIDDIVRKQEYKTKQKMDWNLLDLFPEGDWKELLRGELEKVCITLQERDFANNHFCLIVTMFFVKLSTLRLLANLLMLNIFNLQSSSLK